MTDEKHKKIIKVLGLISEDMKNDARDFEGKPFTGHNVATYLGYLGAAIASIADILKEVLQNNKSSKQ